MPQYVLFVTKSATPALRVARGEGCCREMQNNKLRCLKHAQLVYDKAVSVTATSIYVPQSVLFVTRSATPALRVPRDEGSLSMARFQQQTDADSDTAIAGLQGPQRGMLLKVALLHFSQQQKKHNALYGCVYTTCQA